MFEIYKLGHRLIELVEKLIMGINELNTAISDLATSVTNLTARIDALQTTDLSSQVQQLQGIKAQVDSLAQPPATTTSTTGNS